MNEVVCATCPLRPTLRAILRSCSIRQIAVRRASDTSVAGPYPESVKTRNTWRPRSLFIRRHNTPSDPQPEVPSV
jgi:hypothetical protein